MQLSSDAQIPDGLLAANALLREKPHQGVPSWNLAPHQGIDERNSTAAIGLRASAQLNRIWPRYTGKEHDAESGNDYFGARYYASSMGRWLSPDPVVISPSLGNPQSWNKYSYAFSRPLSLTDPDGKWPTWYHTELDRNYFGNQLHWSMHDQEVIVNESAYQDNWSPFDNLYNGQGTSNVRWHGMDNFWHQVGSAQASVETESYIAQSLNQAVYWQLRADYEGADCSSCHDAALRELAHAEHAGQDLSSPEHRGKPWTMWGGAKHWYDERRSAMSSDGDDEIARAEAVYETQVINGRYQNQLAAARKKQHGPPRSGCVVNASCQR
jgi:RHS repeat-associated protein